MFYNYKIPDRAVVDSNTLLDACFVQNGFSRLSIELLISRGSTLLTRESILNECMDVLRKAMLNLSLCFDPNSNFLSYINSLQLMFYESSQAAPISVNNKDKHVAYAALGSDATVITQDTRLYCECFRCGIPVIFPWELYDSLKMEMTGEHCLESYIRVAYPDHQKSFVFSRVHPGMWAETSIRGIYTVCEIEGFAKICYDNAASSFVFELYNASGSLNVPARINGNELITTYFSYDLTKKKPRLLGKIHKSSNNESVSRQRHIEINSDSPEFTKLHIGHTSQLTDHWNGTILAIVLMPGLIRNDSWKYILETRTGGPNPIEKNTLQKTLIDMDNRMRIGAFATALR